MAKFWSEIVLQREIVLPTIIYSKPSDLRTPYLTDTFEIRTPEVGTDSFYYINTLGNTDTSYLRPRTAIFGPKCVHILSNADRQPAIVNKNDRKLIKNIKTQQAVGRQKEIQAPAEVSVHAADWLSRARSANQQTALAQDKSLPWIGRVWPTPTHSANQREAFIGVSQSQDGDRIDVTCERCGTENSEAVFTDACLAKTRLSKA